MAIRMTELTVEPLPESWDWSTRLYVWGEAPFPVSNIFKAWVGAQAVDGIIVSDGGFSGFLANPPGPGETLVIALPGQKPTDTGLSIDAPTIPVG